MSIQTSVTAVPDRFLAGQLVDGFPLNNLTDVVVDQATSIAPGLAILRSSGGDRAGVLPPVVATIANSIVTTKAASASGAQTLTTADANGSIGAGRISPPAKLELVLNSHANWDATSGTISYLDENGVPVTETVTIPDAGNVTLKTSGYASRFIGASIPQQSGTAATYTIGTTSDVTLDGGDFLGISAHSHKALVSPAEDNNELYEQNQTMPVCDVGRIAVQFENAFRAGDVVMVRVASGSGTQQGAFRAHDNDSNTCVPCRRVRLLTSGNALEYGEVQVKVA